MKKLIFSILLLLSSTLSYGSNTELINTLEGALLFQGYVEIDTVTKVGKYTVVELYVGAYGEERPIECVLKNNKIVDCTDNWFKF